MVKISASLGIYAFITIPKAVSEWIIRLNSNIIVMVMALATVSVSVSVTANQAYTKYLFPSSSSPFFVVIKNLLS